MATGSSGQSSPDTATQSVVITQRAIDASRRLAEPFHRNQIGYPISIEPLSSESEEGWSRLPDGRASWTVQVGAAGAQGLRLNLRPMSLPAGWTIEFADARRTVHRSGGEQGSGVMDGGFSSPVMEGERASLRLIGPADSPFRPTAVVDSISYFFSGFNTDARGSLLPCQMDARCGGVDATALGSVGLLRYQLVTGEEFAVGCVLMADSLPDDRRGYVLTTGRIGEDDVAHNSIDIRWHYINRVCLGGQLETSSYSYGASRLVHAPESDLTLLELYEDLPATLPPTAAPWTDQDPSGLMHALHFPAGSSMRYAPGFAEPAAAGCDQSHEDRFLFHDFLSGTMQPISEGGGVFDSNWNLIGLLSSSCTVDGVTPDCDNHDLVSIVSSRIATPLPELLPWLLNEPFAPDVFEPNDSREQASPIDDGEYSLTLQHDSYDWYAYTPECTGVLRLTFEYPETRVLLRVSVVDAVGTVIAETQQNQNGRLALEAELVSQRPYFISVFLRDQDGGPYHMSVQLDTSTGLRSVHAPFPNRPDETPAVWAAATSGRDWFIGVPGSDLAGSDVGAIYVYHRVADGTWCESQTLTPDVPLIAGHFGAAVAVSSDGRLFVGAPGERSVRYQDSGRAYIFQRMDGQWVQQQMLSSEVGRVGDLFGAAIAADGPYAIVGAPEDDLHGVRTGAAYIFGTENSADGSWIEQARIDVPDGDPDARLGTAVQITGTTASATMPGVNGGRGGLVVIKRALIPFWSITQTLYPHTDAPDGAGTSLLRIADQLFMGGNGLHVYQLHLGQWWNIGFVPSVSTGGIQQTFGTALIGVGNELMTSQVSARRLYKYRAVPSGLPMLVEELMDEDLPTTSFGTVLATDGQALLIDTRWTTAWSADCNANGTPDDCEILSGELSDVNGNGIADECEQSPCTADLAEPFGQLDFFDIQTFLTTYATQDARADLAPPFCQIDFFDVQAYLQAFSGGCQ